MIKVVMRSNNTARCPRIKNFRLIALAWGNYDKRV
jgi:hypothetical protein